jgi:hypothetical protein
MAFNVIIGPLFIAPVVKRLLFRLVFDEHKLKFFLKRRVFLVKGPFQDQILAFLGPFTWVLDHFSEKSFYRLFLTERHLTETPFDRTPFDRTSFDRKAI